MTWRTLRTSTAYCSTDKQFRSVWTTTFATLRWTKSSPGSRSTISFAGTRLSEQPIHRYAGACCAASRWKKSGWAAVTLAAHFRLLSRRCERSLTLPLDAWWDGLKAVPYGSRGRRRAARAGRRLTGVEIVPVHDRVEPKRVGPLRLPAPERPDREHDDVPLAECGIERRRAVGEELAVEQRAREQHVVRVRRELHHDARTRLVDRDAELLRQLPRLREIVGRGPLAAPGRRRIRIRFERLNPQRQGVGRHVLADPAVGVRAGLSAAAAAAAESTAPAAAGVQHRRLVEVHRQIGAAVAVGDRALHVGDLRAQDRSAHEQLRRFLDGDPRRDPVLREDRRRRSFGDERAALLHETRELDQPLDAHAAADVVARVDERQVRELRRLLVRQRRVAGLRHAVDLRDRAAADVREDQDVVLRSQVALTQL